MICRRKPFGSKGQGSNVGLYVFVVGLSDLCNLHAAWSPICFCTRADKSLKFQWTCKPSPCAQKRIWPFEVHGCILISKNLMSAAPDMFASTMSNFKSEMCSASEHIGCGQMRRNQFYEYCFSALASSSRSCVNVQSDAKSIMLADFSAKLYFLDGLGCHAKP